MIHALLADLVLIVHAAFVVFVVVAVPLILAGGVRGWRWVRNPWLRAGHLAGVGVVVAQSWAGVVCPLTTLERWLRVQAGETTYSGGLVEHWVTRLLYWNAPSWVFVAVYTLFAIVVLSTWLLVPPRRLPARDAVFK